MKEFRVVRTIGWVLLAGFSILTCKSDSASEEEQVVQLLLGTIGTGSGTITGPGQISCPVICTAMFEIGAIVNLTASPAAGSVFAGWEKDCAGGFAIVDLEIDDDPECDARFDLEGAPTATLNVTVNAAGASRGKVIGTGIDCGDGATDCSEDYPLNSTVHLSTWKPSGSKFLSWGLDCIQFTSASEIDLPMDADKNCTASFDEDYGGFQARGSFSFGYRVEAAVFLNNKVLAAGYDSPFAEIIDVSNPDALTSPAGADFSTCGARGLSTFFSTRAQYNADVVFATCTDARQASTTLAEGSFSEIQFLQFAPGKSAHYKTNWVAIADFEFGRLRLTDQSDAPQATRSINLSGAERSCPFSLAIQGDTAFVAGREGVPGTATETCNNWVGVWKVDLEHDSVLGFAKVGTKVRDVVYGADRKVYATDFEEDKVHVINSATMTVDRSITVGDGPVGLKVTSMATGMYVTNWNSNKIQYWNLTNDTLLDEEDSGGVHPVDVFISGVNGFVLNFGDAGSNIGGSLRAFSYAF